MREAGLQRGCGNSIRKGMTRLSAGSRQGGSTLVLEGQVSLEGLPRGGQGCRVQREEDLPTHGRRRGLREGRPRRVLCKQKAKPGGRCRVPPQQATLRLPPCSYFYTYTVLPQCQPLF